MKDQQSIQDLLITFVYTRGMNSPGLVTLERNVIYITTYM